MLAAGNRQLQSGGADDLFDAVGGLADTKEKAFKLLGIQVEDFGSARVTFQDTGRGGGVGALGQVGEAIGEVGD